FHAALARADVLLAPTSPFASFSYGGPPADPSALLLNDVLTVPASLAGLPAVSLPVATMMAGGVTGGGNRRADLDGPVLQESETVSGSRCLLPLGMQVIGRPLGEVSILRVAHVLEGYFNFAAQIPRRVGEQR
ncbi:unnamed protein product, partial [Choristocarpus tenellus]